MKKLLYVPIIHNEADLGSLATGIEERARAVIGASSWQKHKEIVRLYWQAIAKYWDGKDVAGIKIFQDAMAADGEVGEKIVKSLAQDGSINHQIIEQLLERGAKLCKTEDGALLKEEYFLTKELAEKKSDSFRSIAHYKEQKDRLLKARDAYMSKRINASLEEGETGVCFLGAYHQIVPNLARDIDVIALKDPEKVRAYAQKYISKQWEREVDRLGRYLIAPIQAEGGEKDE
jgi:hypothetical protein